jgi:hypothetical protein
MNRAPFFSHRKGDRHILLRRLRKMSQSPRCFMLLFILSMLITLVSSTGWACDCATLGAWKRTWHGPNPLATPLRGYFVPRWPGRCDRDNYSNGRGYAVGTGCAASVVRENHVGHVAAGWAYPPEAGMGFEPVMFERLGQVPNDFALGGVEPAGPPSRPER